MHAYTEMLKQVRDELVRLFDVNPKWTEFEYLGYCINSYCWKIKHEYGANVFQTNTNDFLISYDNDRVIFDKNGLQLNIIDNKVDIGVTISKDILVGLICN